MERRKFIATFLRWVFAGGIISVGGTLIHHRKNGTGDDCVTLQACDGCRLFAGCNRTRKKNWQINGQTN